MVHRINTIRLLCLLNGNCCYNHDTNPFIFISTYFLAIAGKSEGVVSSVPNTTFNVIFLVGANTSLSLMALMIIMKRRAISIGIPTNKNHSLENFSKIISSTT